MKFLSVTPFARAVGVIVATAVIVSGVTFAALQSQNAVLAGNSIESATASLQIGTSPASLSANLAGFDFANVQPGGPAVPSTGNVFYLKNTGSTDLNLKLAANKGAFTATSNVDLTKVSVLLTPVGGGQTQSLPLSDLVSAHDTGGTSLNMSLVAGMGGQYKLQVTMAADAVTATTSSASISNLDLIFSGTSI
jgi:hypothetical protein